MDVINIKVETGRESGSGPARRAREAGQIPGVIYGLGKEPVSVAVDYGELRRALSGDAGVNAVLNLESSAGTELSVVKDLQRDPLKRLVTHVDFLRVDADATIEVEVPVALVGEAVELGRENGILQQQMFSLLLAAKPGAAPAVVEVDVADVRVGDSITADSIEFGEGVELVSDPESVIVTGQLTRAALATDDAEGDEGDGEAAEDDGGESESSDSED